MGDQIRTVLLGAIMKEIQRGHLLNLVKVTGDVLLSRLKKVSFTERVYKHYMIRDKT